MKFPFEAGMAKITKVNNGSIKESCMLLYAMMQCILPSPAEKRPGFISQAILNQGDGFVLFCLYVSVNIF